MKVFAILRSQNVQSRKVLSPLFICGFASIISQDPPPPAIVTVTAFPTFVAVTHAPTKSNDDTVAVICVHSSFTGIFAAAEITTSHDQRSVFPSTVLRFVHDTSMSCLAFTCEIVAKRPVAQSYIAFALK